MRDELLGLPPRDADFILAGRRRREFLRALAKASGRRVVTFRKRGIVNHRAILDGRPIDLVEISHGSIDRELRRRDFTINAIARDLATGRLIDPRGGRRDLAARRIRAGADGVFRHDPLRTIRAVRLRSELPGFSIARRTLQLIRRDAGLVRRVSPERVREELDRIFLSRRPSAGILLLDRLGLLTPLIPEADPLRGLRQNRYHHLDAWRHTLAALEAADDLAALGRDAGLRVAERPGEGMRLVLRWSLLFHDLGKAATRTVGEDGEAHFFGHEKASAALAARAMKRLRFPKERLRAIRRLIEMHLRIAVPPEGALSEKACRRIIRDAADLTPLLALHTLADKEASRGRGWRRTRARLARSARRLVRLHREAGAAIASPPRLVDGHDVMRLLSIGPGPEVGRLLAEIRERQAAGEITTRQEALGQIPALARGKDRPR